MEDNNDKKISSLKAELHKSIKQIEITVDPEKQLPENTSFKVIKKGILRALRVYTILQVQFNKHLLDSIEIIKSLATEIHTVLIKQSKQIDELKKMWENDREKIASRYLTDIDSLLLQKFSALRKLIQQKNRSDYKSLYFPQFEDDFYLFQQEKFRGSYKLIRDRQKKYIPYLKNVRKFAQKHPFMDIGFGRGEFLEILKEQEFPHILGVDLNAKYCKNARENGYEAVCADGISYLQEHKGKLAGISAFHVIEHITFEQLFDLIYLAHMKLVEGGLLLFETPNIENVLVSSTTFYIDHTHITKLSPDFMKSLFEFFQFKNIEIVYSSAIVDKPQNEVDKYLFGPMDFAIVANK